MNYREVELPFGGSVVRSPRGIFEATTSSLKPADLYKDLCIDSDN